MRISDWSSDVCSSDLPDDYWRQHHHRQRALHLLPRSGAPRAAARCRQSCRRRLTSRHPLCYGLSMASNHLYLVDGSGYIFRAYHRLPPLTNIRGEPVGAVYGFTTTLWKLVEELNRDEKPTHLAVIFDAGKTSFRNALRRDRKSVV